MKRFMMSMTEEQFQYLLTITKERQVETPQEAIRQLITEYKLNNTYKK